HLSISATPPQSRLLWLSSLASLSLLAPHPCTTLLRSPPSPSLLPYTTLFRSAAGIDRRHRAEGARGLPARRDRPPARPDAAGGRDRKSTRLNSSHVSTSYAVCGLTKKKRRKSYGALSANTEYKCQRTTSNGES